MHKVLQNNKATISLVSVELFCLFVACSYTSMEATWLSCRFSRPKYFETAIHECHWKGLSDFVDFSQIDLAL